MARGQVTKEEIKNKILSTFQNSFIASDGKTIRIPMTEDGEPIEIKVTLTAAKDIEAAGVASVASLQLEESLAAPPLEPSAQEKENVEDLMTKLGLL